MQKGLQVHKVSRSVKFKQHYPKVSWDAKRRAAAIAASARAGPTGYVDNRHERTKGEGS